MITVAILKQTYKMAKIITSFSLKLGVGEEKQRIYFFISFNLELLCLSKFTFCLVTKLENQWQAKA